jgi:hypothetical protein
LGGGRFDRFELTAGAADPDGELPGGQVRIPQPGSLLVMAGVPHAWKNHYDEDCFYMGVVVGATSVGSQAGDPEAKG